ncbi:hypothetical protein NK8_37070 [Caballeronia sp. NK8]|uniref:CHAP domain-containing protein n=1 Tax=Caballeronia sp. NK8 TaxID=140098 RepID=UPI001BB5ABB0|nr:CHAP domain-containing protein [Caballeronia sp. NK8]BCQ25529.1 hypothetical protein NK8_37070 [Caballeronia sp. NK8]
MPFDKNAAANYADIQAQRHSTGNCARYVRRAIEHGGVTLTTTHSAKDYGPILESSGFSEVSDVVALQRGDVVVIQPAPGHPHGHMAMFDGHSWVSDFRQRGGTDGFYPGPAYRTARPAFQIYRHE